MSSPPNHTVRFFCLAFAFTWGLQVPGILAQHGVLPGPVGIYMPFAGLGILVPLAAAIVVAHREGQGAAVKALLTAALRWRVHPLWFLAAVVPAILLTGLLFLLNIAGRTGPIAYVPTAGAAVFGVVASISEEIGWRGFALPRLQKRWGSFAASGLLGVLWCVWHLPMFIGAGVPLSLLVVMLLYFVGGSLLFTWLYNGSGGSVLVAIAAHFVAHLNNSHRALPNEMLPLVVHAIVYAALGVIVMRGALPGRNARSSAVRAPQVYG